MRASLELARAEHHRRVAAAEKLSQPRKRRRRRARPSPIPLRAALGPNDIWCTDFKGPFHAGDGARCDPLTLTDAYSRHLL
jgi:hypothetical protein